MNFAVFFQKYDKKNFVRIFRRIYKCIFLYTNDARIRYLRDAGARIGENVRIDDIAVLGTEPYLVDIGDNTSLSGKGIRLLTHDGSAAKTYYMGLSEKKYDIFGRIRIGSNCFIGLDSIIIKHVTIGDNCIIGAGSVVTKSIPPNSVAGGCPAKVICSIEDYVERNKCRFEDIDFCNNTYEKRKYIEAHMAKYELWRKEREKGR